jgi:hypothetical protein
MLSLMAIKIIPFISDYIFEIICKYLILHIMVIELPKSNVMLYFNLFVVKKAHEMTE